MSDPFNPKIPTTVQALRKVRRVVSYFPGLAKSFGVKEAVFLSQMIYWEPKADNDRGDGWVFKSSEELYEETGLSYKEQLGVRNRLRKMDVIQTDYEREKHRLWIRINHLEVDNYLQYDQHGYSGDSEQLPDGEVGHLPDGDMAPPKREGGTSPKGISFNTEITTENTTESTTGITALKPKPLKEGVGGGFEPKTQKKDFSGLRALFGRRVGRVPKNISGYETLFAQHCRDKTPEVVFQLAEYWLSTNTFKTNEDKIYALKNFWEDIDILQIPEEGDSRGATSERRRDEEDEDEPLSYPDALEVIPTELLSPQELVRREELLRRKEAAAQSGNRKGRAGDRAPEQQDTK